MMPELARVFSVMYVQTTFYVCKPTNQTIDQK